MAAKIKKIQIFRHLIQIISIFLLPGLYISAFEQLKTIYKMIINGNFHFINAFPSLIELTTVILGTILLGRFFCGWICTFGAYNDLIYLLSKKIFKTKFKIDPQIDSILKYTKYLVLLIIILLSWTIGSNLLESTSPWDAFAQITDLSNVISNLTLGLILLAVITIGAFFIERFFCRYLCPLGAIFTLVSKIGFFKIDKPNEKCGSCRACTNSCSMGLPLYKVNEVCGGDCINCLKCVEVCPRKNAQANVFDENINPTLASSVALATFAGLYAFNNAGSIILTKTGIASPATVSANSNSSISTAKYKDGTYTGSGTGFRGATTEVSVTISNGKITNIETLSFGDTPRFYKRIESNMFNKIISAQSTDVDTISGATFSSRGIISAVQDALTQAQAAALTGDASSTTNNADNNSTSVNDTTLNDSNAQNQPSTVAPDTKEPSESKSTTDNTTSSNSGSSTTQNNNVTNNNTAANNDSTINSNPTSSSSQQGTYKDGTYTGSATGFKRGITKVSVTINNGKISKIETLSHGDTPRFYDSVEEIMFNEITSAQSTDVDTVSGATFSCRGIINAVQNALSQAK